MPIVRLKQPFETAVFSKVAGLAIDEIRSKLLDAAGLEFAEKGFGGATVRAICERAGANLAAVNYHFGDKERLYEAVLMMAHQARPPFKMDEGDPRETLGLFVTHFLEEVVFQRETPWHQTVVFREIFSPTKASETLVRESFRPAFESLKLILKRLCPEADDRRINALGFSVVGQCLHYKINGQTSERIVGSEAFGMLDAVYLAEHITQFTLAAIGQARPLAE